MHELTPVVLAASTVQAIGSVIALVAVIGFVVYIISNVRAGREEVGAELELAANLKPYLDDDELETRKLDRTLTMGLATLAIVAVGLPAYWLAEPGRQEGAIKQYDSVFVSRGEEIYTTGAQCNACHGPEGTGGVAPYTILDDNNQFVAQVEWKAPALNTVLLRYSRDEVNFVLNYGRPFSPMPAWGGPGGGPLDTQEISNVIDYLGSIQLTSEPIQVAGRGRTAHAAGTRRRRGHRLQLARHRQGAVQPGQGRRLRQRRLRLRPLPHPWLVDQRREGTARRRRPLRLRRLPRRLRCLRSPPAWRHPPPVRLGRRPGDVHPRRRRAGQAYGNNGLSGDGMMPGFGDNPNTEESDDGMLTNDMIQSIARYVASLQDQG